MTKNKYIKFIPVILLFLLVLTFLFFYGDKAFVVTSTKFQYKTGGTGGFNDGVLWARVPNKEKVGQLTYYDRPYAFGTYKWTGRFISNATEGWITQGFISLDNSKYIAFERIYSENIFRCITYDKIVPNGQMENTQASIVNFSDFQQENDYKIVWRSNYVSFYINNNLVANHTKQVPHIKLYFHTAICVNDWMGVPGDSLDSRITDFVLKEEIIVG